MRIQSVTLYHVDIPMRFAFRTAKETLKHRESIILEVADESGQTGYGEVVSFTSPFYTMETLEASWEALKTSYIPQFWIRTSHILLKSIKCLNGSIRWQ